MKTIYFLLITLIISLLSCQEDEIIETEATPLFLLSGSDFKKWEIIDVQKFIPGSLPSQYRMVPSCTSEQNPNGAGIFYQVFNDGTIRFEDGCGPREFINGSWNFSGDFSSITIQWPSGTEIWQLEDLKVAKLQINKGAGSILLVPTPN